MDSKKTQRIAALERNIAACDRVITSLQGIVRRNEDEKRGYEQERDRLLKGLSEHV